MSKSTNYSRIFLQVCTDKWDDNYDSTEFEGVTWCQDRINDSDIEYIRADLVEQQLAALQETHNTAVNAWDERLGFYKREVQRLEWKLAASQARESAYREEIARLCAEIVENGIGK